MACAAEPVGRCGAGHCLFGLGQKGRGMPRVPPKAAPKRARKAAKAKTEDAPAAAE